ncbi:hypothetical protein CFN78_05405 [Amycolatopsis antarctica]|uniref:Uncharacterized protein n=1 Tax=Amycolatopsis antarctica TaxID=1854586 RepID=A0A263D960_9PSEU|nr:hypothetical protein [Amycolatopsis antarctica]OZM74548.1 hypothetical protein CFN78_05405 [Amycolatopsis antarctica]
MSRDWLLDAVQAEIVYREGELLKAGRLFHVARSRRMARRRLLRGRIAGVPAPREGAHDTFGADIR